MASILFKIRRICKLHLKFNCLKSEKLFFNFQFYLWKLHQILTRWKKETIVIANIFSKLKTVKVFLRPLSKRCRFRTCFDSQHVRASQILANFSWGQFFHAFSSFSVRLIWKLSPLVLGEMLGEFVNTLNAVTNILLKILRICHSEFKCKYLKNKKLFLNVLFHFSNLHQILNLLKKRAMVIANVFPKLQTENFL